MLLLAGISCVAVVLLASVILWLTAVRIDGRLRMRDALADVDKGSVSQAEWQRIRRLKQVALVCLVVSLFAAVCIWAVFGGAIMDTLAAAAS